MKEIQNYKKCNTKKWFPKIDTEVIELLKEKGFTRKSNFSSYEKWEGNNVTFIDIEFSSNKIIHYIFEQLKNGNPYSKFMTKEELLNKLKEF